MNIEDQELVLADERPIGWKDPVMLRLTGEECCAVYEALSSHFATGDSLHARNVRAVRDRLWALHQKEVTE